MILRRLYLYLVSIAALAVLAFGLSALGQTVLLFVFNSTVAQYNRSSLAGFAAAVVVALPVWAIHQWFARRFALRDPAERASAIRRLYLYLACAGSSIGSAIAISGAVGNALESTLDADIFRNSVAPGDSPWLPVAQDTWAAIVLLGIWALHYRIAAGDRAAVGEQGASATLRRWYMYAALLVGLLMMLTGAQSAIQLAWVRALNSHQLEFLLLSAGIGQFVAGALLWGFHARALATRFIEDDRKSTLRAVEGFIAVGVGIVSALIGASQILYYAVARLLGVNNPGNFGNDLLVGLAQPASYVIVYGIAWFLIRRRLARDAASGEATRQAGIRRLYTNLVALVSMAALAVGAASLLGTLGELAQAPLIGVAAPDWKDPLSLWITLLIVGSAVWLTHWRKVPWLEERQALSRRLYLWAVLLASALAVLGGGIGIVYVVFQQAFSVRPHLNDPNNLAFAQSLAVVVVAAAVAIYHFRVLRSDAAARPLPAPPAASPPIVTIPAPPTETRPPLELQLDRHFELSVVGATEDDVHQALANLPPQASYKLKVKS